MLDVNFSNHFTIYVSHIIMLYTLTLHSAVYQLHLNKAVKMLKNVYVHILYIAKELKGDIPKILRLSSSEIWYYD